MSESGRLGARRRTEGMSRLIRPCHGRGYWLPEGRRGSSRASIEPIYPLGSGRTLPHASDDPVEGAPSTTLIDEVATRGCKMIGPNRNRERTAALLLAAGLLVGSCAGMPASPSSTVAPAAPSSRVSPTGSVATAPATAIASRTAPPPKPGMFGTTASMTIVRSGATATLLADGRVLFAGGYDATNNSVASAELYDPTTGAFSPTGSMAEPRYGHRATLLNDGRVLIAGGESSDASAELFDPRTGTFSPTGSMTTDRVGFSATKLNDGRVLIAGGQLQSGAFLASAELYDPKTGTFSPTGSMLTARTNHGATSLADDRVLTFGGEGESGDYLDSAELYDPVSGHFSPTGSVVGATSDTAGTILPDGRVLLVDYESLAFYKPTTGKFTAWTPMLTTQDPASVTRLADGRFLITGGCAISNLTLACAKPWAQLYDPKTGMLAATGSPTTARFGPGSILLTDGRVLIFGGRDESGALTSAELYQP